MTSVDFVVDLLEVNVSPAHFLLCGKWFTDTTTLWLFVLVFVGSHAHLPSTTRSKGHGLRTHVTCPTTYARWLLSLLSPPVG